jgi:hypothetical protein
MTTSVGGRFVLNKIDSPSRLGNKCVQVMKTPPQDRAGSADLFLSEVGNDPQKYSRKRPGLTPGEIDLGLNKALFPKTIAGEPIMALHSAIGSAPSPREKNTLPPLFERMVQRSLTRTLFAGINRLLRATAGQDFGDI